MADALAWPSALGLGDGDRACLAGRGGHLALAAALGSPANARWEAPHFQSATAPALAANAGADGGDLSD